MLGGGARGTPLRDDWKHEGNGILLRAATFARKSGIRTGDGIAYCATGRRVVFAAGHATSLPYLAESPDETHWPWRVNVSLPWVTEFVYEGVPLEHLNVGERELARSIKQHSHIRLTKEEYEAAVRGLGGTP
jgi:hypothetical protein